jgi:2-methylcitrate dehydratase PrpD
MPQAQTKADSVNATQLLAEFVAGTNGASIPHAVLTCIEECLLDFVGNTAYAGRLAESSPAFRAGAGAYGGDAVCTVVGESTKYSPMQAALLNGAFAHTLDFDDTNVFSALHPGASVIPAAIVQAEQGTASGAALVSALALGYEVTCRIGGALGLTAYDRGFHPTAVADAIVVAATRRSAIVGNAAVAGLSGWQVRQA